MSASTVFDRITIEVGKMNGQPCIRGLRLTVRRVLEALSTYDSREELRADYPELEDEDIRQALAYRGQHGDSLLCESVWWIAAAAPGS